MILALGPMAGYTDAPFRSIVASLGANYTVSEMVSAMGLLHARADFEPYKHLLAIGKNENNLHAQIFGSKPYYMAEACRKISDMGVFSGIDINMGCSVKKIVNNGEGSALMKNPKLASEVVNACAKSTALPISVKMRIGWNHENINAVEFAQTMQDSGANLLSVHGRTREQMYSGTADWDTIALVKQKVDIPVIANGDIVDASSAKDIIEHTKADGIMIARAAIGNPWIFANVGAFLYNKSYTEPSNKEKCLLLKSHIYAISDFYGENRVIKIARSQIAHYFNRIGKSKHYRVALCQVKDISELIKLVEDYYEEV